MLPLLQVDLNILIATNGRMGRSQWRIVQKQLDFARVERGVADKVEGEPSYLLSEPSME